MSHSKKRKGKSKSFHTSDKARGMGQAVGVAMRQPMGRQRSSYLDRFTTDNSKGHVPRRLA